MVKKKNVILYEVWYKDLEILYKKHGLELNQTTMHVGM